MAAEIFEIAPKRWGYRLDGLYQECDPDLPGCAAMDEVRATTCAARLADGNVTLTTPGTPRPISARQIRLALHHAGLLSTVQQMVDSTGGELSIWWEYSTEFHRANPLVAQMATALGVASEQVDAIWQTGANL